MKKIIYIPVDERPCTYKFPGLLSKSTDYQLISPPLSLLGLRKKPGNVEGIWEWLETELSQAEGLIVSLDMLLYGGLVPSRTHDLSEAVLNRRLAQLIAIKDKYPALKIYGFQLIMRSPANSSGLEEPTYYGECGKEIFTLGTLIDKEQRGQLTEQESCEKGQLEEIIPPADLQDYRQRRQRNLACNLAVVDLIKKDFFDYFIFPQDDTAPFGFSYMDQRVVKEQLGKLPSQKKVTMYPGADEIGCTLLARYCQTGQKRQLRVYPRFSSPKGGEIIPTYEDRSFLSTIKSTILATGGLVVDSASEADIVLLTSTPGAEVTEAALQQPVSDDVESNKQELCAYGEELIARGVSVVISDSYYANGGDLELFKWLKDYDLLFSVAGYAGWNTHSNTLGTALSQGIIAHLYGQDQSHREFLYLRYIEDLGYCGQVRQKVKREQVTPKKLNPAKLAEAEPEISGHIKEELSQFIAKHFEADQVTITKCRLPWTRMFEVDLELQVKEFENET